MGQFVYDDRVRMARKNSIGVHFLECRAPIFQFCARDKGQVADLRFGSYAPVGFEITYDDILPALPSAVRFLQRFIRFAHACCKTEKHLEPSAPPLFFLGLYAAQQFVGRWALIVFSWCHERGALFSSVKGDESTASTQCRKPLVKSLTVSALLSGRVAFCHK